jgi:hypothetical protein
MEAKVPSAPASLRFSLPLSMRIGKLQHGRQRMVTLWTPKQKKNAFFFCQFKYFAYLCRHIVFFSSL